MAKTKADPTGQARNRRNATRALARRITKAQKAIRKIFSEIPRSSSRQPVIVNETLTVYQYDISDADLERISNEIRTAINLELLESRNGEMVGDWWWEDEVQKPYFEGTANGVVEANQLLLMAIALGFFVGKLKPSKVDLNALVRSSAYQNRVRKLFVDNFNSIKGLADKTSSQVIDSLFRGVAAGLRPASILADLDERFDVAVSGAARIANTGINEAFTDAKMEALRQSSNEMGFNAAVQHVSALLPTTRADHAARHGLYYTIDEQMQWWDTGSNRINCHCDIKSVLLDANNKPVETEANKDIKEERSSFEEM